jgi:hypothetical protein
MSFEVFGGRVVHYSADIGLPGNGLPQVGCVFVLPLVATLQNLTFRPPANHVN